MRTKTLYYIVAFLLGVNFRANADETYQVIRAGETARLKHLLAAGLSPDQRDLHGNTLLMRAAMYARPDMLEMLLQEGASINAANDAGATALMLAAGDTAKIKLLVENGANVNARSAIGNSPLMLVARANGSAKAVELLLQNGAEIGATNNYGANAIITASASGDIDTVRLLVARGANVNSHSRANQDEVFWGGGRSPLMWAAARGDLQMIELLLKSGADVNSQEGFGTALTQAAWMDQLEAARLLLKNGADVNAKERFSGFTALHWAASSEKSNDALISLLLSHGANPNAEGGEPVDAYMGIAQTPLMLASKRGDTPIARALIAAGAVSKNVSEKAVSATLSDVPNKFTPDFLRSAVDRSIVGLQKTALASRKAFVNHATKQDCVSCHQQYSPMAALGIARASGLPVDLAAEDAILEMVRQDHTNRYEMTLEATFHPEPVHSYGYDLFASAVQKQRPTPEIDALVHHLLVIQGRDGQWHNNLPRPPIQTSDVGATALAVQALATYGFAAQKAQFDERISRARSWLWQVQPANTEERIYQILGLAWSGESKSKLEKLAQSLASKQRADGGWSQLPKLASDAYATGQALFALHTAGLRKTAPEFRNGLRFLLATQREDGSWFVARRAFPFQPTMQSGYSYGRDGWISASGASWAVMALSLGWDERNLHASAAE